MGKKQKRKVLNRRVIVERLGHWAAVVRLQDARLRQSLDALRGLFDSQPDQAKGRVWRLNPEQADDPLAREMADRLRAFNALDMYREADTYFLLVALRQFQRWAEDLVSECPEHSAAFAGFKATAAEVKDLRDMHAHEDEYLQDSGWIEDETKTRNYGSIRILWNPAEPPNIRLGGRQGLELEPVVQAVHDLGDLLDRLSREVRDPHHQAP